VLPDAANAPFELFAISNLLDGRIFLAS